MSDQPVRLGFRGLSEYPTRQEVLDLPEPQRQEIASKVMWANLLAPPRSASDQKWNAYREAMRLLDFPDFIVQDVMRQHHEWKEKRNARRRERRQARAKETT